MLIAIILPEFYVGRALEEFVAAYRSTSYCTHLGGSQWTMTHASYANIGSFVLRRKSAEVLAMNTRGQHRLVMAQRHLRRATTMVVTIPARQDIDSETQISTLICPSPSLLRS